MLIPPPQTASETQRDLQVNPPQKSPALNLYRTISNAREAFVPDHINVHYFQERRGQTNNSPGTRRLKTFDTFCSGHFHHLLAPDYTVGMNGMQYHLPPGSYAPVQSYSKDQEQQSTSFDGATTSRAIPQRLMNRYRIVQTLCEALKAEPACVSLTHVFHLLKHAKYPQARSLTNAILITAWGDLNDLLYAFGVSIRGIEGGLGNYAGRKPHASGGHACKVNIGCAYGTRNGQKMIWAA